MGSRIWHQRTWKTAPTKTINFDGTAGNGAVGTVLVYTVTGRVFIRFIVAVSNAALTGATATIALGSAGNPTGLIFTTTATDVSATNVWWSDTSPETGLTVVGVPALGACASQNIIITVATADVTGGGLIFECLYTPLSDDGQMN